MISEIYNQRILELAGNIPRLGRLANPDASAKAHSRLADRPSWWTFVSRMGGSSILPMT